MSPRQRETYENGVNFLRRLANRSPRFKVVERDGEIVIVDGRLDDGEVLLRVEPGLQAERVAEYFNHIGYYLLIDLVGLLENVSGTKAVCTTLPTSSSGSVQDQGLLSSNVRSIGPVEANLDIRSVLTGPIADVPASVADE